MKERSYYSIPEEGLSLIHKARRKVVRVYPPLRLRYYDTDHMIAAYLHGYRDGKSAAQTAARKAAKKARKHK